MSITQKYLKDSFKQIDELGIQVRPLIKLKDGFTVSIQASSFHYCTPRRHLIDGQYDNVEVGYPNQKDSLLTPYMENEDYDNSIYPFVPIEVVDELIEKHGGIAVWELS